MGTTARTFSQNVTNRVPSLSSVIRSYTSATIAANTSTITSHGETLGSTTRVLIPGSTNSSQGATLSLYGWAWNLEGADGMDGATGARRVLPAGNWEFRQRVTISAGAGVSGRHAVRIFYTVYRVLANGERVSLASGDTGTIFGQTLVQSTEDTTTFLSVPAITLEPGESLQVSMHTSSSQQSGTLGATTEARYTFETGGTYSRVIVPSPGYRTLFEKSQSDSAPAVDGNAGRQLLLPRAVTEQTVTAEAVARFVEVFRSIEESFPTATVLERRILFSRALEEITSVEVELKRRLFNIRNQVESIPTGHELSAAFTGQRAISQSIPTEEQLARQQTLTRQLTESTSVNAQLTRQSLFRRVQPEGATTTATLQRALTLARSIEENHPTVDSLERVLIYVRGVAEDLAQGGGDINVIKRIIQVFDD